MAELFLITCFISIRSTSTYSNIAKYWLKVGIDDKLIDTPRITRATMINHNSLKFKEKKLKKNIFKDTIILGNTFLSLHAIVCHFFAC